VRWKQWNETVGQTAFAAHPGDDGRVIHCVCKPYLEECRALDSLRFVHEAGALAGLAD
jgi:hypothetical protein